MTSENRLALANLAIIVASLVAIIVYVALASQICPFSEPIDIQNTTVLRPDSSVQTSKSDIASHNAIVRDMLIQWMAMDNAQAVARESSRTQMRGFYLAILAGLLAFLLRSVELPRTSGTVLEPSGSKMDQSSRRFVVYVIASIIFVVYMLEVHQDDLHRRYHATHYIYSAAVMQLTDSAPVAGTWQSFDYSKVKEQMNQASRFFTRWSRILLSATRPGADQIALYFLPLIVLIVLRPRERSGLVSHKNKRAP
jgi:hypothetical protein